MQVALFIRHARGLVLTHEGQQLLNATRDVQSRIEEAEQSLREAKGSPQGILRVTTMVTFGAIWLTPHLKTFVEQYPDIEQYTPNYHIASYLGITQQSLSRIRAEKAKK